MLSKLSPCAKATDGIAAAKRIDIVRAFRIAFSQIQVHKYGIATT
ncbi:hypothetical protein [Sphingobium abikonense]